MGWAKRSGDSRRAAHQVELSAELEARITARVEWYHEAFGRGDSATGLIHHEMLRDDVRKLVALERERGKAA